MSAGVRHPVAWIHSHVTRRRGVSSSEPVPGGANEVLERLAGLPISTWTYGFDHDSVRHLGPTAQDFARTFGLGDDPRHIAAVDANGVCMASIQALHRRLTLIESEMARRDQEETGER
ncbi:tail fiber domain-containing protein [Rhodococcus sp. NPDC058521]|uniref:tail fiber domain-containing protein n=1 Tax=Rhodococcus sp. NPDC058521 TaxID=3346536 RepID=UPI003660B249